MKKTAVFYYSQNGSNDYLAKKIATDFNCPIEEIKPIWDAHVPLMFGLNFGIKKLKIYPADFKRIVLVGPIWMGKVIAPLKSFVNKYKSKVDDWVFITCCGSSYEKKDEKFGHGLVFEKMKKLLNGKCSHCEALPITLVIPEEKREDGEVVMKTRLNDETFRGEILEKYEALTARLFS